MDKFMENVKKLKISDLLTPAEKKKVDTSVGSLYLRNIVYGDYVDLEKNGNFQNTDPHDIGLFIVKAISSSSSDVEVREGLDDELAKKLSSTDYDKLASAAINVEEFKDENDALAGLGKYILSQYKAIREASYDITRRNQDLMKSFLSPTTVESLNSTIASIYDTNQRWYNKLAEISASTKISKNFVETKVSKKPADLYSPERRQISISKDLDTAQLRAAEASEKTVETLKDVAIHMSDIQSQIATLSVMVVNEVMPAWARKQEQDKRDTEISLSSAAQSLLWTKWAVIISVFTSIIIAVFQQHNSSEDSKKAEKESKDRQAYWERKIEYQQDLSNRQIAEIQNLRDELAIKLNNEKKPSINKNDKIKVRSPATKKDGR